MGLDLSWKEQDKLKFGNCREDLSTIVYFRVPYSSGAKNGSISNSPERDSRYILNNPRLHLLEQLELPEGEN